MSRCSRNFSPFCTPIKSNLLAKLASAKFDSQARENKRLFREQFQMGFSSTLFPTRRRLKNFIFTDLAGFFSYDSAGLYTPLYTHSRSSSSPTPVQTRLYQFLRNFFIAPMIDRSTGLRDTVAHGEKWHHFSSVMALYFYALQRERPQQVINIHGEMNFYSNNGPRNFSRNSVFE